MIYALTLIAREFGTNLLDIQFKDVYGSYVDLFSSFITAMEGMITEVFKRNTLEGLDLGDMTVELRQHDLWKLVILCDKNIEINRDAIDRIVSTVNSHQDTIERYINRSTVVRDDESVRAELIDIISDMATDSPDKAIIDNTNDKLSDMIRVRQGTNLATQYRIVRTKMKILAILGQSTNGCEKLLSKISSEMESEKLYAQEWLTLLKNAVYDEYMQAKTARDANWANIFYYFANFSASLSRITKNEVVNRRLGFVQDVLNSVAGNPYDDLLELIQCMDDQIDAYIYF